MDSGARRAGTSGETTPSPRSPPMPPPGTPRTAMAASEVRVGSLYSGVGGLDLGVQGVFGGRIVWHAETDPGAARVVARHWPRTPNLGDVRIVDFSWAEPVDILTAGFPCQELSVAGPRTGLAGPRSGLWQHVAQAVQTLRPPLVVIENVRGLLTTRAGIGAVRPVEPGKPHVGDLSGYPRMRALGVLLGDLADCGYDSAWACVHASDVGAPHRRARIFVAAWPATSADASPVEDADGELGQQRQLPASGQAQGGRARADAGRRSRTPSAHSDSQRRSEGLSEPAAGQWQPHPGVHRGDAHRTEHSGRGERPSAAHPDLVGRQRRSGHDPEAAGRHEPENSRHSPAHWWGGYLPAIRRWEHVTGRTAPTPTVPGARRLSAEFVEWMMGLPEGWVTATEDLSRVAQLRLLGNSVVPQQAVHALNVLLPGGFPDDGQRQPRDSTTGGQR
ncbi:DNA (cytosine-5-)-methyltransferase [Streptomyces violascens]|uniref:DNA cytosine methyltransferase n=1 Tax=Streptomyces violascens TaxID=67381 RepID=UPI0037920CEA